MNRNDLITLTGTTTAAPRKSSDLDLTTDELGLLQKFGLTAQAAALIAKHGLSKVLCDLAAANGGAVRVEHIDEALKPLPSRKRIEAKLKLAAAGVRILTPRRA